MARDKSRTTRLIEAGAEVDTTRKRKRAKIPPPVKKDPAPPVEKDESEAEDDESSEISEGELAEAMDQDDEAGPVTQSGDKRFKVPTHDEMDQFKTAETMFKNSLFSMQVAELLEEVSVQYTKLKPLEELLHEIKSTIEAMEDTTVTTALPSMTLVGRVTPELQFRSPTRVDLVGSYLARTLAKPALSVDLAVQMPSEAFHPKDFLNYRYADKRALYLSHMAATLAEMPQLESVQVEGFCRDTLKPVLVLTPAKLKKGAKLASKFVIRIFPTVDASLFPEAKLLPTRNNVRATNEAEGAADTPLHNNSVVEDMMLLPHLELTHGALCSSPSMQECVMLLKVWLKQHQLLGTVDGFTGFTASMMLTHLLQERKVSPRMSSYQLFKIVLEFITAADFTGAGVAMDPAGAVENLPKFAASFPAVFLDPSSRLNLLARAGAAGTQALKQEATITLDVLQVSGSHCFDAVFVRAAAQLLQYDEVITLPDLPHTQQDLSSCIPELEDPRAHAHKIETLLKQALGDRAQLVRCISDKSETRWALEQEAPVQAVRFVGIVLDPDNATRLVDKGPSSDQAEAAREFRGFWGDRAELRHFRDGTILESVVWQEAKGDELRIPELICAHILNRHLKYPLSELCFSGHALSPVLELPGAEIVSSSVVQKCLDTFERVCTNIRGLPNLPLEVTTIQPTCEALRHTAVFGPFQSPLAGGARKQPDTNQSRCVEPLKAVIALEASGKWPDDLQAIAHLKAAFYLHLARGLRKEHEIESKVSMDWLRVLCDGHVFELSISHPREIELMRDDAKKHGAPALNTLAQAVETEHVLAPRHTALINGFQSKHPAYSAVVRLAKRWLHAHMLSQHFEPAMVELLVAHLFAHPHPYREPHNATCGLLRFFLLLSSWDWDITPLVVDVNNELREEDHSAIMRAFEAKREAGSGAACVIATPIDRDGSHWTAEKPSGMVFSRMCHLARESLTQLCQPEPASALPALRGWDSAKRVFKTDLSVFDVLIRLNRSAIPSDREAILRKPGAKAKGGKFAVSKYKNVHADSDSLLIGFDPVAQYVKLLQTYFGKLAAFFYDQHGGSVIAVAWCPDAFVPQQFKVIESYSKMAVQVPGMKGACQMVPNVSAILVDFERLGEGLVDSVEVL